MRRAALALAVLALAAPVASCSSGKQADPAAPCVVDTEARPRVDLVAPAIAALETELGGPQQFFEINATSKLVNLWVSLNDGTIAQNWLYFDGELTSKPGQTAQGNAFPSSAVTFEPDKVLAQVEHDLPSSSIDLFLVEGGPNASVRYTAVLTSDMCGQLEVTLGPDGTVQHVDAGLGTDTIGSTPVSIPLSVPTTAG